MIYTRSGTQVPGCRKGKGLCREAKGAKIMGYVIMQSTMRSSQKRRPGQWWGTSRSQRRETGGDLFLVGRMTGRRAERVMFADGRLAPCPHGPVRRVRIEPRRCWGGGCGVAQFDW